MNNATELAKTADLADALDGLADEIQEVTSTQAGYEFSSQGERVRAVVTLETSETDALARYLRVARSTVFSTSTRDEAVREVLRCQHVVETIRYLEDGIGLECEDDSTFAARNAISRL